LLYGFFSFSVLIVGLLIKRATALSLTVTSHYHGISGSRFHIAGLSLTS
jgi:hypothetical protein